jgi:predicted nucleotide-binding protein (sugar kinase/HSP70/actin superfamily)
MHMASGRRVGIVRAFTGHYEAVQIIARFLQLMDVDVASSELTTPKIMEMGTTLASADLCLPLRVYVGHVCHLLLEHPNLDAIVAPNVHSPDAVTSTCAKYRDVGGVAIRSLSGTVTYLRQHAPGRWTADLDRLAKDESAREHGNLPRFLMPAVNSVERTEIRNACYDVYADLMGWQPMAKARLWLPGWAQNGLSRLEEAVDKARDEVLRGRNKLTVDFAADQTKPRLALVGRPYLINDPLLTSDLKRWFERRGVSVCTAKDVPRAALQIDKVDGFYDSHREGQAFIDWVHPQVDGIVCVGCFGCHPDAFQVDFLTDHARDLGAACWSFRFDESVSQAGFHTRFETILTFLEQRRDARLRRDKPVVVPRKEKEERAAVATDATTVRPVLVWPYMGEILNSGLEEMAYQLGLGEHVWPPSPLCAEVMALGDERYTESCSPFAYSTGSLKNSLLKITEELEARAARGEKVPPHRIVLIMLHGEGPCTFGWYSLVQKRELPTEFAERLAAHGHTVEMATAGMDGAVSFLRQLGQCSDSKNLHSLLEFAASKQPTPDSYRRLLGVWRRISAPVWMKLDALERLRAESLILRAHEHEAGSVAAAFREAVEIMRTAHCLPDIARAEKEGEALLKAVPRDSEAKPRVVIVGEIYVALTSFANRGTVETLLAREGIEVIEGISLTQFARHSLRNIIRRAIRDLNGMRPLRRLLHRRNANLLPERVRDSQACPFLVHEVGGDGIPTVAAARRHVEAGCQGIIHIHPFKCMPEGIAKDAVKEIASLYGARYLALSFDRETDIERLRTEVCTYAALLHAEHDAQTAIERESEIARRQRIGRLLDQAYEEYRRGKHTS